MLIDSHAHLQDDKFSRDLDRVIQRAEDAGIERVICVSDRIETSRKAVQLARAQPRMVAAIGIHPHHDAHFSVRSIMELEALAADPNVVAIGEIGLDTHYPGFDLERQRECFVTQAHLAHRHKLPIIIHCRDAYDELIEVIRDDPKIPRHGVVHCYGGTVQQARQLLDLGFHLGIGGALTYPNAEPLRELVREFGLDRILVETDAPYLPPQHKRGRRNEPSYIKHTVHELAQLAGLDYQDAARITKANTIRLFGLPDVIEADAIYQIRRTLYLCMTNQCPNHCYYCQRCHDYMLKGHLLKLDREPEAAELLARIEQPADYSEIVLSGLGEPTMRWDVSLETARLLKQRGARVRLNTNGLGSLLNGRDIAPEMAGVFDGVSINLVAQDKAAYNIIAQPDDPDRAWEAMMAFAADCREVVPDVVLTVVAVPEVDVEACRRLVEDELQVRFRVREYRPNGYPVQVCAQ